VPDLYRETGPQGPVSVIGLFALFGLLLALVVTAVFRAGPGASLLMAGAMLALLRAFVDLLALLGRSLFGCCLGIHGATIPLLARPL
jgi:hypothetical protein